MAKSKLKLSITGRWLIKSVSIRHGESLDEKVRGHFEFGKKGIGSFQVDCVQGQIDYQIGERNDKSAVEFSWDGHDEMDPVQGRGWLVLEGDKLKGMFYTHFGEELGLVLRTCTKTTS